MASDHSPCIRRILASVHDGRITVYQAADLSALLLRPVCFHPAFCTSAMMELMPCATHSRLWCGFDADSSRLPSPFPSLLISVARLPLLSLVSHSIICSSIDLLPSTILLQHILTTSVIALRPFALYFTSLRVDGFLRKVRDSNPRIVLTIAALAVRCFQPLSQPSFFLLLLQRVVVSFFASLLHSDNRLTSSSPSGASLYRP